MDWGGGAHKEGPGLLCFDRKFLFAIFYCYFTKFRYFHISEGIAKKILYDVASLLLECYCIRSCHYKV